MSTTTVPARLGIPHWMAGWLPAVPLARVLDAVAAVIAAVVTIAAAAATTAGLFAFAEARGETLLAGATFSLLLVGLWALLTCYSWRARLRRAAMPAAAWVLLVLETSVAAIACATGDSLGSQVVNAAPVAALAAVTVLLSTVTPTGQNRSDGRRRRPGPQPDRDDGDGASQEQAQPTGR